MNSREAWLKVQSKGLCQVFEKTSKEGGVAVFAIYRRDLPVCEYLAVAQRREKRGIERLIGYFNRDISESDFTEAVEKGLEITAKADNKEIERLLRLLGKDSGAYWLPSH